MIKLIINQLGYFQAFQKFMRKLFKINFMKTSMINFFSSHCGFRKRYSSPQNLLVMTIKFKGSSSN